MPEVKVIDEVTRTTPEQRAPRGRRWSDARVEPPELLFATYLAGRPSTASALRFLIALLAWPIGAKAGLVLHRDGAVPEVVAEFMDCVETWFDPEPRERARTDLIRMAVEAGTQRFTYITDDAGFGTCCVWTLGANRSTSDAMVLILTMDPGADLVRQRADRVVDLLAVYLAHNADAGEDAQRSTLTLSTRQQAIVRHLADDLTMRQIARRIGFSESTVRMESLAIYRALGVHDRRGAVAAAIAHGIIPVHIAQA